jgi:hypothetical protein
VLGGEHWGRSRTDPCLFTQWRAKDDSTGVPVLLIDLMWKGWYERSCREVAWIPVRRTQKKLEVMSMGENTDNAERESVRSIDRRRISVMWCVCYTRV